MYQITISPQEIEAMPMVSFSGKISVIDATGPEFNKAIAYLRRQKILGFDTESRPCFSPGQPHYGVSLLQLSGPERAFLFRVKQCGMPKSLCNILASKDILKIGAATSDDVRGLQKYCGFKPEGFLDLQRMVWEYGIKDKSVKKMAAIILGIKISKTQQLSNWEAEILSDAQQKYASTDAWVCREMYLKLLKSEKNPLTPEQMLPNPPKSAPVSEAQTNNAGSESSEPDQKTKLSRSAKRRAARKRAKLRKASSAAVTADEVAMVSEDKTAPVQEQKPARKKRSNRWWSERRKKNKKTDNDKDNTKKG